MAGLIRVISTSIIRPSSGDHHRDFSRIIDLTPSDGIFLGFPYARRVLLFDKHRSPNSLVEHLKASLSLALDRFYPLAGRLVATKHDGDTETLSFSIACNNAGAMFVHAEAVDTATADILHPDVLLGKFKNELFPMTGTMNNAAAVLDLPLLAVQVTELANGVFVAISLNHSAADGTTFWDLFNVWSALARGDEAAISQRASFYSGRESLHFPLRVPLCLGQVSAGRVPLIATQQRMLRFSREKIAELKAKANTAEPKSCDADRAISSLQALMAHLWVCVTRSRGLRDGDEVSYVIAIGLRSRLQPPLPQPYIGNAVRNVVVRCTAGELLGRGMGWAARRINKMIAMQSAEEASKFFYNHENNIMPLPEKLPPNLLITGGSPWFDVYGNDFGWGRPMAVRSAPALDGGLMVFQGATEGSVDFETSLLPETFRALADDPEFTVSVTP